MSEPSPTEGKCGATGVFPTVREFLLSSSFLAGVSAAAYFLTYAYEFGYASTFHIPLEFISPNLTTVFSVGISLLCILNFLMMLRSELCNASISLPIRFYLVLLTHSPLLLLGVVLALTYLPMAWVLGLYSSLGLAAIAVPFLLAYRQNGSRWTDKCFTQYRGRCVEGYRTWIGENQSEFRWCLRNPLFVLELTVAIILVPVLIGHAHALHRKSYLVLSDRRNTVVIRQYGETLVCGTIDRSAKLLYPEFTLLKAVDDGRKLRLEDIGPLVPTDCFPSGSQPASPTTDSHSSRPTAKPTTTNP